MPTLKAYSIIRVTAPIAILILISFFLNNSIASNPDEVKKWLDGFGLYAVFAYIIVQTAAIVVAPIGGSAFALAVLLLFGPFKGTLLVYLVTTPAYFINFILARRFGMRVVSRLTGKEGIETVTKFTSGLDTKNLLLMKLFLNGYFDYISYGVGLSTISAKRFVLINLLAGIPTALFTWTIMRYSPNFTVSIGFFYLVPTVLGIVFLLLSRRKASPIENAEKLLEHEL